jgi:hypothetical protein
LLLLASLWTSPGGRAAVTIHELANDLVTYRFVETAEGNLFLDAVVFPGAGVEFTFKRIDLFTLAFVRADVAHEMGPDLSDRFLQPSEAEDLAVTLVDRGSKHYLFAVFGFQIEQRRVAATVRVELADGELLSTWYLIVGSPGELGWALHSAQYPILAMRPLGDPADDRLTLPYRQGAVLVNPHEKIPDNLWNLELRYGGGLATTPPVIANTQWASFGDPGTPAVLYLATEDGAAWYKHYRFRCLGDAARYSFIHYAPGVPGRDNLPYVTPYPVRVGPLPGDVYDAAQYYRAWALQQPFAGEPLSTKLLPPLRQAQVFTVFSPAEPGSPPEELPPGVEIPSRVWRLLESGLARWKSFLGVQRTAGLWYGQNVFEPGECFPFSTYPPQAYPVIWRMQAAGDIVARYWRWNTLPLSSAHFQEMEPLAVHELDGSLHVEQEGIWGAMSFLNPSAPEARTFQTRRLRAELDAFTVPLYYDVQPKVHLDYTLGRDHPPGGGNYYTVGLYTLMQEIRSRYAATEVFFQGPEYASETLLAVSDFAICNYNGINAGMYVKKNFWLLPEAGFSSVYHDYLVCTPTSSLGVVTSTEALFLAEYMHAVFLSLGMMPTANGSARSPFPPEESIPAGRPFFDYFASLVRTYDRYEAFLKYGRRYRDLTAAEIANVESVSPEEIWTGPPEMRWAHLYTESWYPEIPLVIGSRWFDGSGEALVLLVHWRDEEHGSGQMAYDYPLTIPLGELGFTGPVAAYESVNGRAEQPLGLFQGTFTHTARMGFLSVHAYRLAPAGP